uniref:Late embryogenesis abundant protein LEA-2 subgroup domain-containing protein n=1 Tax=Oryza meridionalis TaxID=40149 RepID=A0A0E0C008_9ORYZ
MRDSPAGDSSVNFDPRWGTRRGRRRAGRGPARGGVVAVLFLLYRLQAPPIAATAVQLPSFASRNGTLASVRNPNRSSLAHYDSSLRIAYAGGEVVSVYIPTGQIDGGRTQYMATSFTVPPFAVTSSAAASSSLAQTIAIPASGLSLVTVGTVAL